MMSASKFMELVHILPKIRFKSLARQDTLSVQSTVQFEFANLPRGLQNDPQNSHLLHPTGCLRVDMS